VLPSLCVVLKRDRENIVWPLMRSARQQGSAACVRMIVVGTPMASPLLYSGV
jgi:hypothetical protein